MTRSELPKKTYYDPAAEGDYPTCPHCGEICYDEKVCAFCEKEYEIVTPERGREITIHREGYTICQAYNHHVHVYDPSGKLVLHATCQKQLTVAELEAYLRIVKKNTK